MIFLCRFSCNIYTDVHEARSQNVRNVCVQNPFADTFGLRVTKITELSE